MIADTSRCFSMRLDKARSFALTLTLATCAEKKNRMLIDDAHRRIMAIGDAAARELYVRALRSSVIWDGLEDGHLPTSAEDVVAMTGVDSAVLEANYILLSKQVLAEYATELGAAKTLASIRKGLTASSYQRLFLSDRNAVRSGKKLLLTYAEARMFLGVRSKGQMPNI